MPKRSNGQHGVSLYTPQRITAFLDALSQVPDVTAAAKAAGVSRKTTYEWRRKHPDFAEQWDDALDQSMDALEGEMYRRAFVGTEKPIYQGGRLVGHETKYSDVLAIFMAKAHRPERFRDNAHLTVAAAPGLEKKEDDDLDLSALNDEQKRQFVALLELMEQRDLIEGEIE